MNPNIETAIIAGAISLFGGLITNWTVSRGNAKKLIADRDAIAVRVQTDIQLAMQKLSADKEATMSDRAWADYELRRDRYIEMAEVVGCLFDGGDISKKARFHEVARTVRLVGSDEVVRSLNDLTNSMKEHESTATTQEKYAAFFNAMRQDIRTIYTLPPEGTALGPEAFPIES